ncbi:MAG TPA: permease prefix domain 1-containing protein [Verrucomicrobiae bacterium]|nr:permease prefix domain 1-containing protein [Verrucomicrobiae bacterium]
MTTVRNFDADIAEWRGQLFAAGIKDSRVLDELESHLREEIERRIHAGVDVRRAFQLAVARLGEPQALKVEFDRIEKRERKYMKRSLMIGVGILGVMVGMALVMPAVAQYRQIGVMRNNEPWLFLIGSLMTLAGCVAGARGFKKKRA